jgi:hypothetical protein
VNRLGFTGRWESGHPRRLPVQPPATFAGARSATHLGWLDLGLSLRPGVGFQEEFWIEDGGAMTTGRGAGRAVSTKRVKTVVAIALGMMLKIAGAAPASAQSPNALFKFRSTRRLMRAGAPARRVRLTSRRYAWTPASLPTS